MMTRTFGTLELNTRGTGWVINSLEPHVAIRLKQLFPKIAKTQTKDFKFPNDPINCTDLYWFIGRYPLEITDRDRKKLTVGRKKYESNQAEMEQIFLPDYVPSPLVGLKPGHQIRPYQVQPIDLIQILPNHGLLLGDDVGLGKTYAGAGLFLLTDARPAVAVVETHLQGQWMEKLTEFTDLRVHAITVTKPYDLPEADVYIFKYSQLLGWIDFFKTNFFKSVAFDEIQQLRTGTDSQKGAAAKVLCEHVKYRLGLSATPIYNYGSEIWNIMQFVDPSVLGKRDDFLREWTDGDRTVKNPEALGTFLREQRVFLRRTKREVGQQMPPINRIVEIVDTDRKALDDIATLAHTLAVRATTGSFVERGAAARELDLLARHATGVAKARSVAAYARILLDANIPVVLMGWHRDVYDLWLRDLDQFNPVMYTGSESPTQKQRSKDAFVNGDTNLFIMSLRSGAGVDGLQYRCSTVIFGELDWSGKIHEQVIGRFDREGQEEQITAIFLNSDEGSDPPMVDLLGIKASQASGITDPGRVFEAVSSDTSRIEALARQFLDKRELRALDAAAHPMLRAA